MDEYKQEMKAMYKSILADEKSIFLRELNDKFKGEEEVCAHIEEETIEISCKGVLTIILLSSSAFII